MEKSDLWSSVGFTIFILLINYLLFAFIYFEWNPLNWMTSGKIIAILLVSVLLRYGLKNDNGK